MLGIRFFRVLGLRDVGIQGFGGLQTARMTTDQMHRARVSSQRSPNSSFIPCVCPAGQLFYPPAVAKELCNLPEANFRRKGSSTFLPSLSVTHPKLHTRPGHAQTDADARLLLFFQACWQDSTRTAPATQGREASVKDTGQR